MQPQRHGGFESSLTLQQWDLIKNLIPKPRHGGRRRRTQMRSVVNAVFYLLRTGCAWRYLPKSFPPWQTVYRYFSSWSKDGVWQVINYTLCSLEREHQGRTLYPSLVIIDAQSVRASVGEKRGYDGFKKVQGRKRNIIVDTLGLIWSVNVHSAHDQDRHGGVGLLRRTPQELFRSIHVLLADRGYARGPFDTEAQFNYGLKLWFTMSSKYGTNLKPKRWIVERTFSWMMRFRRLVRDYERTTQNSEAMITICMIMIVLHKLTGGQYF
jgi:putative transposase